MAQAPLSDEQLHAAVQAVRAHGTVFAAARVLGIPRGTFENRVDRAIKREFVTRGELAAWRAGFERNEARPFQVPELPPEVASADELVARRRKEFAIKQRSAEARILVPVPVGISGPIGIALFGDPHVDDPGTDIALLERHTDIINRTEGLFAGNVGDYSNNWVGRLARLYAEQGTSAAEAWVLVEWLIRRVPWLFLIGGNHDLWSGAGDPIQWMAKSARVTYQANGMRLALMLGKREIRLNARHDFRGHSMWNTAHGPAKAAQLGWRDHVLVCGHLHVSGHQVVRDPATGLISHAIRVGSYKTYDRYAEEKGLPNQTFMVAPTVIIRPQFPDDDNRLITVLYDPETAAEFLTFLRKRKSEPGC